jgi:hypothetical protein
VPSLLRHDDGPRRSRSTSAGVLARIKQLVVVFFVSPFLILVLAVPLIGTVSGVAFGTGSFQEIEGAAPSDEAKGDIPLAYFNLYRKAGADYGLQWEYLAAIGKIESNHGRSTAVGVQSGTNFHGCCAGPMQFCVIDDCPEVGPQQLSVRHAQAGTWGSMGVDGDGDGDRDPWDPDDAIPAAANYLKQSGAPADWDKAILAYNKSLAYLANVKAQAAAYRAAQVIVNVIPGTASANVVNNDRISFGPETEAHEADILAGRIDPRILTVMNWIAGRHSMMVTSMRIDHEDDGGNHPAGRAIDIGIVDGVICRGARDDPCGRLAVELSKLPARLRSTELIYCFDPDGDNLRPDDAWAQSDHCDHIHFGYDD